METYKRRLIWTLLTTSIIIVCFMSITMGEYDITFLDSIKALFGYGEAADVSIIRNVRLPRIIAGLCVGVTLSLSGIFVRTALKNPLADSGILGIQTGATTFVLFATLYLPNRIIMTPIFAFVGASIAFFLTILFSSRSKSRTTIILTGVSINAFFSAFIGLMTILNVNKLQSAVLYLNGSLVNITKLESNIMLVMSLIVLVASFIMLPVLKTLKLDDQTLHNLGVNTPRLRIMAALFGVLCASISVAFVGVISFVGIIVPSISEKIVGPNIKYNLITSSLIGALFIVSADFIQRMVFAPMEIPVGIIVGLICAPTFLFIIRGNYGTKS